MKRLLIGFAFAAVLHPDGTVFAHSDVHLVGQPLAIPADVGALFLADVRASRRWNWTTMPVRSSAPTATAPVLPSRPRMFRIRKSPWWYSCCSRITTPRKSPPNASLIRVLLAPPA
jgi:hypothetical protein